MTAQQSKIWVNSADSHVLEPDDLWTAGLPSHLRQRGPRVEREEKHDVYYIDDKKVFWVKPEMTDAMSPPGMVNLDLRLADLDEQGIWSEVVFASTGLWITVMTDRELARESSRLYNDWAHADLIKRSERYLPAAMSTEELTQAVDALLKEIGVTEKKDLGRAMKEFMGRHRGRVDGKAVNALIASRLK